MGLQATSVSAGDPLVVLNIWGTVAQLEQSRDVATRLTGNERQKGQELFKSVVVHFSHGF